MINVRVTWLANENLIRYCQNLTWVLLSKALVATDWRARYANGVYARQIELWFKWVYGVCFVSYTMYGVWRKKSSERIRMRLWMIQWRGIQKLVVWLNCRHKKAPMKALICWDTLASRPLTQTFKLKGNFKYDRLRRELCHWRRPLSSYRHKKARVSRLICWE